MLVPPGKRLCARRFAWGSVFVKCFSSRCGAAGFGVLCASVLSGRYWCDLWLRRARRRTQADGSLAHPNLQFITAKANPIFLNARAGV